MKWGFSVVGTGVDPVTSRFSDRASRVVAVGRVRRVWSSGPTLDVRPLVWPAGSICLHPLGHRECAGSTPGTKAQPGMTKSPGN